MNAYEIAAHVTLFIVAGLTMALINSIKPKNINNKGVIVFIVAAIVAVFEIIFWAAVIIADLG